MFGMGPTELLIIGAIAVLLFGSKLPEVARSLGTSYREFKKGLNEFHSATQYEEPYHSPTTTGSSSYEYDEYDDSAAAPRFEPPPADDTAAEASPSTDGESSDSQSSNADDAAAGTPADDVSLDKPENG